MLEILACFFYLNKLNAYFISHPFSKQLAIDDYLAIQR